MGSSNFDSIYELSILSSEVFDFGSSSSALSSLAPWDIKLVAFLVPDYMGDTNLCLYGLLAEMLLNCSKNC